jgi:hypothetical protein
VRLRRRYLWRAPGDIALFTTSPNWPEPPSPAANGAKKLFANVNSWTTLLGGIIGILVLVILVLGYFCVSMASMNSSTLAAAQSLHEKTVAEMRNNNDELTNQIRIARNEVDYLRSDLEFLRNEVGQKMEMQESRVDPQYRRPNYGSNTSIVSLQ